ncbi:MAG TPA: methyltransferase domain-containing protein [Candidatus Accumulibacter phosphatis]|nr:MAG: 23S rRNA (guanine(745)-N(1))-methyltransferase [Candidatus Accumulibacter sp. SK-11]HAY27465.1 methyltransferase domain-containing protein [Accumulibacter sp.]HRL74479.1 methyltransferase domain-containing protein [Candidatus Accumulibacter phosphatis]HCN67601.1 methyltransferase domain-containing protein [Accumulibacter sp.]HCV12989.1 methyltransferase domain-containing protein [Accumulibacter sp.]
MNVTPFQALACPLDRSPLQRDGATWRCAAGHSYDIARQGHTHLLPVQNKRSRDPGDSREMVAARRRFLNSGAYDPIATAINRAALADLPASATASCLDAGCGEGYYLRQLAAAGSDRASVALIGVDISRWAVAAAARQDRRPNWVVASNANVPVQSATLDCVLCVFGFPVHGEFARILRPGGLLLQVDAGHDHLRELREIIYPSLKPPRDAAASVAEGFVALPGESVRYSLHLGGSESIADLLAMTPHLWRASAARRAHAGQLTALSATVDVRLTRWRRSANG